MVFAQELLCSIAPKPFLSGSINNKVITESLQFSLCMSEPLATRLQRSGTLAEFYDDSGKLKTGDGSIITLLIHKLSRSRFKLVSRRSGCSLIEQAVV